jgi:hypothetical protein
MKTILKQLEVLKKQHKLYLISLRNSNESFLKIGITTTTVEQRCEYIPYQSQILFEINLSGIEARAFESLMQEMVIPFDFKYWPKKHFNGYTQCYHPNALKLILEALITIDNRINPPDPEDEIDELNFDLEMPTDEEYYYCFLNFLRKNFNIESKYLY